MYNILITIHRGLSILIVDPLCRNLDKLLDYTDIKIKEIKERIKQFQTDDEHTSP
jgi:hypothetical protein